MTPEDWRLFIDGVLAAMREGLYLCLTLPVLAAIVLLINSAFQLWRRKRP